MPVIETPVSTPSSQPPWCKSEMTPIETPMTSQMIAEPMASESVRGMPRAIAGRTSVWS